MIYLVQLSQHWRPIRMLVRVPVTPIQLPANGLGEAQEMAQVFGTLPPMWESWEKPLGPGFDLD